MSTVTRSMDGWNTLPWTHIQRQVFQLQKRMYRATRRHDVRTVRKLQRLLLHSWSARLLAVRQVTQDNHDHVMHRVMWSKGGERVQSGSCIVFLRHMIRERSERQAMDHRQ